MTATTILNILFATLVIGAIVGGLAWSILVDAGIRRAPRQRMAAQPEVAPVVAAAAEPALS